MDKPNNVDPRHRTPLDHQADICPVCGGMPKLLLNGCDACHGTGRRSPNILPFPASPTPRQPRPATLTCDCVRTGRLLYGGDASPCPLCGGEGKITPQRATDAYHLILRHQHELPPLITEHPTQTTGMTLDAALAQSRYGAYCLMAGHPGPAPCYRIYLECVIPGQHDRFHVYSQGAAYPVGMEALWLIVRDTLRDAIAAKWAEMPDCNATIWWPLPKEAVFPLAAEAHA